MSEELNSENLGGDCLLHFCELLSSVFVRGVKKEGAMMGGDEEFVVEAKDGHGCACHSQS